MLHENDITAVKAFPSYYEPILLINLFYNLKIFLTYL